MIKRILGTLVAIASLAVMTLVVLNRHNYRSLLTTAPHQPAAMVEEPIVDKTPEQIPLADTLPSASVDSLRVGR